MGLDSFARFFVRFNGFSFLFWAVYELFSFPQAYRNYAIVKHELMSDSILAQEFYILFGRLALQILAAALLLLRTDKVITFVLTGKWRLPKSDVSDERKG